MHMGGHFIMPVHLYSSYTSAKDEGVIFQFYVTEPALIWIHVVVDVLANKINIQGLLLLK